MYVYICVCAHHQRLVPSLTIEDGHVEGAHVPQAEVVLVHAVPQILLDLEKGQRRRVVGQQRRAHEPW